MSYIEMTDAVLLELLKREDHAAFNTLFSRYWDGLYRQALGKTGDSQAAFDIVQDIFVWLWQERNALAVQGSLPAYLFGILRNKIFNFYRSSRRHSQQLRQLTEMLAVNATAETQQSGVNAREEAEKEQAWDRAVDRLPAKMKEIYILRSRYQYSYRNIAETLNIKPQTAKNAYSRAQELLRKYFSDIFPPLILLIAVLFST